MVSELCTWEMFEHALIQFEAKIKKEYKFTGVYGIPRGGLILAVSLSHRLNIPLILDEDDIKKDTLIVDDIVDGGSTLARFKKKNHITLSLYVGENAQLKPDLFQYVRKANWVEFPWEAK